MTADAGTSTATPDLTLPTQSPFFGKVKAEQAVAQLQKLFAAESGYSAEQKQFSKSVVELQFNAMNAQGQRTASARKTLRYGLAVLNQGEQPPALVGVGLDDMICIGSIAKLALLYAAFQLRADTQTILGSWDAPALDDPSTRPDDAPAILAAAFQQADDEALRTIGKSSTDMPIIDRIFDLDTYLSHKSGRRDPGTKLEWSKFTFGSGADGWGFGDRLEAVTENSDDNAATSCIADIGLPYIQALLTRTGLADVSGQNKGLWLASSYGWKVGKRQVQPPWPPRENRKGARMIVSGTDERRCVPQGSTKEEGHTGQGGTVRALAAFYMLLQTKQLVDSGSSESMLGMLDIQRVRTTTPIVSGLDPKKTVRDAWDKVGIVRPWFHDSSLIVSAMPGDSASAAKGVVIPSRKWIAAVLLSFGEDGITDLAPELEAEVEKYLELFVR